MDPDANDDNNSDHGSPTKDEKDKKTKSLL